MNNYESTGGLIIRKNIINQGGAACRRTSTGKLLQKNVISLLKQIRCCSPPYQTGFKDTIVQPRLFETFRGAPHESLVSSSRGQYPMGVDSDFLPFSYDYQDLPSPGPPQPFEFNDGLPNVAFVSGAESVNCDDISYIEEDVATEKKSFKSKLNPHDLIRKEQLAQGYLWYAAYDEDINTQQFQKLLQQAQVNDKIVEDKYLKTLGYKVF